MLSLHNIIIVHLRMSKRNQFLPFPLLRKQGKSIIYNGDIHTVYMYYSKHEPSDVEHFEMAYNNDFTKARTTFISFKTR